MEWKPDEIKGLRKKLSLSQRQFAKRLGVKRQTVACWESGIRTPSKKMIAEVEKLSTKSVDRKSVDKNQFVDKFVDKNQFVDKFVDKNQFVDKFVDKSVDTGVVDSKVVDSKVVDMVKNVDKEVANVEGESVDREGDKSKVTGVTSDGNNPGNNEKEKESVNSSEQGKKSDGKRKNAEGVGHASHAKASNTSGNSTFFRSGISKYDPAYIVSVLELLGHREAGGVTEVRIFPHDRYLFINNKRSYVGNVVSGYYDDYEKLAFDISPFDGKGNIYITINPCKPELLARAANRLQFAARTTTSDDDILCDLWFIFDTDPVRPAEISSTNDELQAALARRDEVASFLSQWAQTIKGMSGNGGHGLIRLPGYPNNEETRQAKEKLTHFLSEKFTDLSVSIDNTVFNMSRIWKLYGTLACKGDNVSDRPHRRSYLEIPEKIPEPVDFYAQEIIPPEETQEEEVNQKNESKHQGKKQGGDDYPYLDVPAYLNAAKEAGRCSKWRIKEKGAVTWYQFEICPLHTDYDGDKWECGICQSADGKMGAKCMHEPSYGWQEFKGVLGDQKPYYVERAVALPRLVGTPSKQRQKSHKKSAKEGSSKEEKPSAEEVALQFLKAHFTYWPVLRYRASSDSFFTLRYYRDDWWEWDGQRYIKMRTTDLRGRVARFIDNLKSREVSFNFVTSVLEALRGRCLVPAWAEMPCFIGNDFNVKKAGHVVVFSNGILDFDAMMRAENVSLKKHTPTLFTQVALPYPFSKKAECPEWLAFLNHNLEGDEERIAVLQEFVGYCLFPSTRCQKFLLLEGESRTGKSTFTDVVTALLGEDNVSHVPLEMFGQRFALSSTLGKLANICGDTGEIDSVAEGQFKQFTGGDRMDFERKYRDPIHTYPTARVIIATNNRPRFLDRSEAIWERMILVPWNKVIPKEERDEELRERIKKNELSGILLWGLAGEARRREQGHFTQAQAVEDAIEDYKQDTNPARTFLMENYEADPDGVVSTPKIYEEYAQWCRDCGYHPLGERNLGKEVRRVFPQVQRIRKRNDFGKLHYVYCGITQQK